MKNIDLDVVLTGLDGTPIMDSEKQFTLGKALSNVIISDQSEGKMKLYNLGQKFYAGGTVELDASDFALTKNAVRKCGIYSALVLGQVESILENI